ncbi:MAG: ATP-binding protein [Saprospiraceae bacterium]
MISNNLIITKLENSVTLYKAIQDYNSAAINTQDFPTLLELTLNTFSTIFRFNNCMILEYFEKDNSLYPIYFHGFASLNTIQPIPFNIQHLENQNSSFTNKSNVKLAKYFEALALVESAICPIFKRNGDFYGFVICGNNKQTNDFAQLDIDAFTALSHQAGFYINNYRANEQLRLEIDKRNIAKQKIAEQTTALKRSNEDLQQFAYVISHDLKAPLRNITSFAQLLEHSFPEELTADAKEYLSFILTGVKQLGNLIDDLLLYSRASKKTIDFEPVEFDLIMDMVKYNLNISIQESDAIIEYDELPTINASFNQMTLLFQNLISNAIKFRQDDIQPVIKISSQPHNEKQTLFMISDNGIGIEKEYSDRIFLLFQRLHGQDEYEGTGLGLSICKKIMERHKGEIWVESNGKNKGATFFILLPNNL